MNKTAFGKQYTFEDVARLVCKGADPTDGLVHHFRFWAWPMAGFPKIEQKPRLTRGPMVEALNVLRSAADIILGGLADSQQMTLVMDAKRLHVRVRRRIRLDAKIVPLAIGRLR
jgi:hypothetical protein